MSRYPCKLIEDLLPLYLEDDVHEETKKIVAEHLEECSSCKALLQEYRNDEIDISNYPEDLPQANTFKKWMKSLKVWAGIGAVALLTVIIVIGAVGYKIGQQPTGDILTVKQIVGTLKKGDIKLREINGDNLTDKDLNGHKPTVFQVGETADTLLIYTFKSFVEREDIVRETKKYNFSYSFENIPFNAKNALIVYQPDINNLSAENMQRISAIKTKLDEIIFEALNNGESLVFQGESEHWETTITLKYYQHWWKAENGRLEYESYHTEEPIIRYKKADIEKVGNIAVKYESTSGGGSSSGLELDRDGYARCGKSGGNGAIPSKDSVYTVTVEWLDQEETMELKAF